MMETIFSGSTWPVVANAVKTIISAISPEKIYLLSVLRQKEELQSIFVKAPFQDAVVEALNILVLKAETEKRTNDEIQDIIEHRLNITIPVTAIVLPLGQFCDWLKNDHPFAVIVNCRSHLCYDAGRTSLVTPKEYDELAGKKLLAKDLDKNTFKAKEFLVGAELYMMRRNFELAAFHLHQAVEQIYSGIICYTTGLRMRTHNLDKLYRYSRYLLPGIKDIFPRNSDAEEKLFYCLQKAYLGGRYSSEYSIKSSGVEELFGRIKKMLVLCQNIQQKKLNTAGAE
jgi:uncharacterized protein